jgi:hypothetical protein
MYLAYARIRCKVYIIRTCAAVRLVSRLLLSPAHCGRNSSPSRVSEISKTDAVKEATDCL